MPEKYNMNYFRYTGRTKPVLLLLKIAEEEHQKKNTLDKWDGIREDILAKRFPLEEISILQFHGKVIAQSPEIFQYVATALGLCGSTEEDKSKVRELIQSLNTLFNKIGDVKFDKSLNDMEKKKACAKILGESGIQRTFNTVVHQIINNGHKFYFGEKVSAADIFYYSTIRFVQTMFPKALAPYRGLEAYTKRIANIEFLKADLKD